MNRERFLDLVEKALNPQWFSPPNRGALAYLGRLLRRDRMKAYMRGRRGIIMLTSECNLRCFGCVARGPYWRSEVARLDHIIGFLRILKELDPGGQVHLTGGEPTLYNDIEKVAFLVATYGFKLGMLTNGARLVDLTNFDYIYVDDHGVNRGAVERLVEHCRGYPHLEWGVKSSLWHRDTAECLEGNITKGARCQGWMASLMLRGDVFYPCCVLPTVDFWRGGSEVEDALREAGWHVDNPDAADYVRRWRETLPGVVFKVCALDCCQHSGVGSWRLIGES